jgi:hypothetical protein
MSSLSGGAPDDYADLDRCARADKQWRGVLAPPHCGAEAESLARAAVALRRSWLVLGGRIGCIATRAISGHAVRTPPQGGRGVFAEGGPVNGREPAELGEAALRRHLRHARRHGVGGCEHLARRAKAQRMQVMRRRIAADGAEGAQQGAPTHMDGAADVLDADRRVFAARDRERPFNDLLI